MTSRNEQPHFEHPQPQSHQPLPSVVVDPAAQQLASLQTQVQQLQTARVNLSTDIIGLFETVSTAPTGKPTNPWQQVKIYVNGATYRLYWYDANGQTWHYVTATA